MTYATTYDRHAAILAVLTILWGGVSAFADTLRCQSSNGNLNCAGSNGVSCQTINGHKTCISGHGDVVQTFGGPADGPADRWQNHHAKTDSDRQQQQHWRARHPAGDDSGDDDAEN
jgi:hypothetical protein